MFLQKALARDPMPGSTIPTPKNGAPSSASREKEQARSEFFLEGSNFYAVE
jgi:hypothetical protein